MADVKEYVETTKEYTKTLMEVKIALTEIKGDVKIISDMKVDLGEVAKTARNADNRSINNEKDIADLNDKADGIINNDRKKWGAIAAVISGFVFEIIYFLLTFRIK